MIKRTVTIKHCDNVHFYVLEGCLYENKNYDRDKYPLCDKIVHVMKFGERGKNGKNKQMP